jgi:hypothetical protein
VPIKFLAIPDVIGTDSPEVEVYLVYYAQEITHCKRNWYKNKDKRDV